MKTEELNAVGESELSLEDLMRLAIYEGYLSYREGNKGYGCVIAMNGRVIAVFHEKSTTEQNALSHAVSNTITLACKNLGTNSLSGTTLVCTHELCPMCAALAVQVGVGEIAYGYLNKQVLYTGRLLVSLTCREIISKASTKIKLHEGVLAEECTNLYRKDVKEEIARLQGTDDAKLQQLGESSKDRRRKWFYENEHRFVRYPDDPLFGAYQYLLDRLNITERMAPIVLKNDRKLVYHLSHFCSTLEACRILDLETHHVCGALFDESTDLLVKLYDPRLKFYRNYDKLRPECGYCEEVIELCE